MGADAGQSRMHAQAAGQAWRSTATRWHGTQGTALRTFQPGGKWPWWPVGSEDVSSPSPSSILNEILDTAVGITYAISSAPRRYQSGAWELATGRMRVITTRARRACNHPVRIIKKCNLFACAGDAMHRISS
eukprot:COSAG02_NODE_4746_length_5031_cov_4.410787_9_plen_132_part_00